MLSIENSRNVCRTGLYMRENCHREKLKRSTVKKNCDPPLSLWHTKICITHIFVPLLALLLTIYSYQLHQHLTHYIVYLCPSFCLTLYYTLLTLQAVQERLTSVRMLRQTRSQTVQDCCGPFLIGLLLRLNIPRATSFFAAAISAPILFSRRNSRSDR